MKILTINNVNELINKSVCFASKQYEANSDVWGQATITGINLNDRHPLSVVGEAEEGEMLQYAFINERGEFCLGDSDRPVWVWSPKSKFLVVKRVGEPSNDRYVWSKEDIEDGGWLDVSEDSLLNAKEAVLLIEELRFYCSTKGYYNVQLHIEEVEEEED